MWVVSKTQTRAFIVSVVAATNKVGYEGTNVILNEFKFLKVCFQNTCVGKTIQVLNGRN